jgi:hypothetical protein
VTDSTTEIVTDSATEIVTDSTTEIVTDSTTEIGTVKLFSDTKRTLISTSLKGYTGGGQVWLLSLTYASLKCQCCTARPA